MIRFFLTLCLCLLALQSAHAAEKPLFLLNVSYDPTRELYADYNKVFSEYWKQKTGQDIIIQQSHGGSAKQARSVIDGLRADVVTLALAPDIDAIATRSQLLSPDWQTRLPNHSSPYYSTIVFLVRSGNPKHIVDWDDLTKDDVQVITPNPKTSGGARWNYIAAWGYALKKFNNDEASAKAFMQKLYQHVPMFDTGARSATSTFVERGMGDVLIAWENEALMITRASTNPGVEIVMPSLSIRAEPVVAVVDANVAKKGNTEAARAYLEQLYTAPSQALIARHFYRPVNEDVLAKNSSVFQPVHFITIDDLGGWKKIHATHFAEGGLFDQISTQSDH